MNPLTDSTKIEKPKIPSELLVRCEDIPNINTEQLTMGDLYTKYIDLSIQYTQCATKNDKLIKATKHD